MRCEFIDQWKESLTWTPSQLFRKVKCGSYVFTLYLRWRHEDPWQFHVALGDMGSEDRKWEFITEDLFQKHNIFFKDVEYKDAEAKAEELFIQNVENIIKDMYKEIKETLEKKCGFATIFYDSFKFNMDAINDYIEYWENEPDPKIGMVSTIIDKLLELYYDYHEIIDYCIFSLRKNDLPFNEIERLHNILTILVKQARLHVIQFLTRI